MIGHGTPKVQEVYPPQFWLPKENIIQGLSRRDEKQSWHACVHLKFYTEIFPRHAFLVLGVDFRYIERRKGDVPLWDDYDLQISTWCTAFLDPTETLAEVYKRDFSRVRENFKGSCEYEGLRITLNEVSGDKDYVPFMSVMGEYMCAVDFDGSIKPREAPNPE